MPSGGIAETLIPWVTREVRIMTIDVCSACGYPTLGPICATSASPWQRRHSTHSPAPWRGRRTQQRKRQSSFARPPGRLANRAPALNVAYPAARPAPSPRPADSKRPRVIQDSRHGQRSLSKTGARVGHPRDLLDTNFDGPRPRGVTGADKRNQRPCNRRIGTLRLYLRRVPCLAATIAFKIVVFQCNSHYA
jgi:hypothetical protein